MSTRLLAYSPEEKQWVGRRFDPERFDPEALNKRLATRSRPDGRAPALLPSAGGGGSSLTLFGDGLFGARLLDGQRVASRPRFGLRSWSRFCARLLPNWLGVPTEELQKLCRHGSPDCLYEVV